MKTSLYVIHDSVAKRTSEPFSSPNDESAIRNFLFGCFAANIPPQDSILFCVGKFSVTDEDSTDFSICDTCTHVVPVPVEKIEAYHKLYCEYFAVADEEEIKS